MPFAETWVSLLSADAKRRYARKTITFRKGVAMNLPADTFERQEASIREAAIAVHQAIMQISPQDDSFNTMVLGFLQCLQTETVLRNLQHELTLSHLTKLGLALAQLEKKLEAIEVSMAGRPL